MTRRAGSSRTTCPSRGASVRVSQSFDAQAGDILRIVPFTQPVEKRPSEVRLTITIDADNPVEFSLRLRMRWWLNGPPKILESGRDITCRDDGNGFALLHRTWVRTELTLVLPKRLSCWPLADNPGVLAFLDGPIALAGLVEEERTMIGDVESPLTMLTPDDERHWSSWQSGWRTVNQPVGWRFKPLMEIGNETYTVYFPVRPKPASQN